MNRTLFLTIGILSCLMACHKKEPPPAPGKTDFLTNTTWVANLGQDSLSHQEVYDYLTFGQGTGQQYTKYNKTEDSGKPPVSFTYAAYPGIVFIRLPTQDITALYTNDQITIQKQLTRLVYSKE